MLPRGRIRFGPNFSTAQSETTAAFDENPIRSPRLERSETVLPASIMLAIYARTFENRVVWRLKIAAFRMTMSEKKKKQKNGVPRSETMTTEVFGPKTGSSHARILQYSSGRLYTAPDFRIRRKKKSRDTKNLIFKLPVAVSVFIKLSRVLEPVTIPVLKHID